MENIKNMKGTFLLVVVFSFKLC